jgi:nitrite reductase (NADH) small subunit
MDGGNMAGGWVEICGIEDIPRQGARVVNAARGDIAVFRTLDDAVFAVDDKCPHKGGPLSQGIVHGHAVTCPLHNWVIDLESGEAAAPDEGCVHRIPVRVQEGRVLLALSVLAAP